MKTPENEQPIEEQYLEVTKEVARFIDSLFNPDKRGLERETGWVVLVFPFGTNKGRMNYLSNAHRSDMLIALKEFIAKNEGRSYEVDTTQ